MEMLKYLPVKNERISAIDGKKMSLDEIYKYLLRKDNIDYGDTYIYACLLSHFKAIKKFSETDYNYALILEDDATLEFSKYWNKKISEIINEAPKDWGIIMLTYTSSIPLENTYEIVNNGNIVGAGAYIINNKVAKEFVSKYYINNKLDIRSTNIHSADFYIYDRIKTYCYKYPYFIYPTNNDSFIHSDHLEDHKNYKKIALEAWINNNNNNNNKYINYILLFLILIFIIYIWVMCI
jgi:GR25 family glycosyltransferase involved in LPS biosynthesis